MRNVLIIFINDLRSIAKQFFAFVIAIALCLIPALYAWFNIYSNWDPYGGTGNISIALVSRDEGYTLSDGEYKNEGAEIVEEMAAGTSIHWVPTDYSEAMAGTRSGKYYGALILGEHLSRNMYNMTEALYDEEPSITFVQNAKTNAIANKITETASTTAEHNIQLRYLSILIRNLFERIDEGVGEVNTEENIDELIRLLSRLEENLDGYVKLVSGLQTTNIVLGGKLHAVGDEIAGMTALEEKMDRIDDARDAVEYTKYVMLLPIYTIQNQLAGEQAVLTEGNAAALTEARLQDMINYNNAMLEHVNIMKMGFPPENQQSLIMRDVYGKLVLLEGTLNEANNVIQEAKTHAVPREYDPVVIEQVRQRLITILGSARDTASSLEESLLNLCENLMNDLDVLEIILGSIDETVSQIPPVMYAADGTLYAVNGTLKQIEKLLINLHGTVEEMVKKLEDAKEENSINDLIEILHGDPEEFAEFLSNPVEVETQTIYPINSYGTAMGPFYTTLALWVGCVCLAAVIKVEARKKGTRHVTKGQLFWGRFMTYFFMGQLQAAIIVWGDLHILGMQCLHPALFYLAASLASFTFVCLNYSLVLTFGDVGKAIGVVIMIVQIAGSSGSYPIEILPEIFTKIYLFFPYPYAINAMREAICGVYKLDYVKYLAQLLIFAGVGLFIGLVLKEPFHGINEFVEEEMHESGVL